MSLKRTAEESGLTDGDDRSAKKQKVVDLENHIDKVPIEALLTIFLWVPYEELHNCAVVNKSWAHLLRQKELWKQKTIKKYGDDVVDKKTERLLSCLTDHGIIHDWRRYFLLRSLHTKVVETIRDLLANSGLKGKQTIKLHDDLSEEALKLTSKLLAYPRFTVPPESLELYLAFYTEYLKLYADSRMPEKSMILFSKLVYDFVIFVWNVNMEHMPQLNAIFTKYVSKIVKLCIYSSERDYGVPLLLAMLEICVVGKLVYPLELAEEFIRTVITLSATNSSLAQEWTDFDATTAIQAGTEPGQAIRAVIEPLFQDDKASIATILLNIVHELTSHADYRVRASALSSLKSLGVNPTWLDEALPKVIDEVLPLVTDVSNGVRMIAVDLLYVGFDTVLDSCIQNMNKDQLKKIIHVLVAQITVTSTTRLKCPIVLYSLLVKYSRNRHDLLSDDDINLIGEKLLQLLEFQITKSEHVNDVLNFVADFASYMHEGFSKFYEPFVKIAQSLLTSNVAKKSDVITTMTLLGVSIGKDLFMKDVKKILDDILGEQSMEMYKLDDFSKGYFLAHSAQQIYECLLDDFDEYSAKIIPILLDTAERAIEMHQEAMNLDGDDWHDVPMPENIQLTFERPNAEQADLKLDALVAIIYLIKKLNTKFAPFAERTLMTFINVTSARELPGDKNGITMYGVMGMLCPLVDIYATTVTQEKLREIYDQIIETLQGTFSDNIIDFEYYDIALQTIRECFTRMKGRFELTKEEFVELLDWFMEVIDLIDFNRDDAPPGGVISDEQVNTDCEITDTLISIIELNKPAFFEAFKTHAFKDWILDRTIIENSNVTDDLGTHEQHNATVFLDIMAEHYREEVWEYIEPSLNALTSKISIPDPYLRQSVVYGIGTVVQQYTNRVEHLIPTFITKLLEAYNLPNKADSNSLSATDNVISTLMKIWTTKPNVYDYRQIFGVVLEWGPIREDFDEAKNVHPVLLNILLAAPELVLDNGARIPLYIKYIIGMISKPFFVKDESVRKLIVDSWNLVKTQYSDAFNAAYNELNDMQKNMIEVALIKGEWPIFVDEKPKK